jgi:DNA-binding ferritin-like protein
MEERLKIKLEHLYNVLKLYEELYSKTRHYHWRLDGVYAQIEALEQLRDNTQDNWMECYKEDLAESKLNK